MSGSGPTKIYIKVDSAADTQENMKNSRKTFKVLQKTADKENLVGRNITSMKENLLKSESLDSVDTKRMKLISACSQTTETEHEISAEDEITSEHQSKNYYKALAATRQMDLEESLRERSDLRQKYEILEEEFNSSKTLWTEVLEESFKENQELQRANEALKEELINSRNILTESKKLVELLTDMLEDNGEDTDSKEEEED